MTTLQLPDELKCEGKGRVEPLDVTAELYKRYSKADVIADGGEERLAPARISLPNFSVNCGLFCAAEHVLFPRYGDWGIARFYVKDVPPPMQTEGNKGIRTTYTFTAEHAPVCDPDVPEEENYAHSEVRVLKDGQYSDRAKINSATIKQHFRLAISRAAKLITPAKI